MDANTKRIAARLTACGDRRRKLIADLAQTEDQIHDAAIEALRAGIRPGEVAAMSSYSPAQLRALARGAGIEKARPGKVPRPNRSTGSDLGE